MFSSEGAKDSVAFIAETKEFVCNLATFDLREQMNATSAPLPRGDDEMERAGLDAAPSRLVQAAARGGRALRAGMQAAADRRSSTTSTASRSTAMSCSARWSASISTIASSGTAGSTRPRCSRSPAAATTNTPWSKACSRCGGRPPEAAAVAGHLTVKYSPQRTLLVTFRSHHSVSDLTISA